MGHGRIGPYRQDTISAFQLHKGVGHRPTAKRGGQPGHRRRVSETGAVVDVVVTEHCAGEFLKDVSFFVGAPGRTRKDHAIRPISVLQPSQLGRGMIQGLVPGGLLQRTVPPDQRDGQVIVISYLVNACRSDRSFE